MWPINGIFIFKECTHLAAKRDHTSRCIFYSLINFKFFVTFSSPLNLNYSSSSMHRYQTGRQTDVYPLTDQLSWERFHQRTKIARGKTNKLDNRNLEWK